jgi:hypothetical protein
LLVGCMDNGPYHSAYSGLSESGWNFIDISGCLDDVKY